MFASALCLLAQAAPAADTVSPYGYFDPRGPSGKLLLVIGIVVLSYLIGRFLSSRLRMRETRGRLGIVAFALLAAATVIALGWPPRLAIDLSGGVTLVYELKPGEEGPVSPDMLQQIKERIDPGNVKQTTVRTSGARRIEIVIPRTEPAEVQEIKNKITNLGTLEFLIVANRRDHEDANYKYISQAQALPDHVDELHDPADPNKRVLARWIEVDTTRPAAAGMFPPTPPGAMVNSQGFATRTVERGGRKVLQALCRVDPTLEVNGGMLTDVSLGTDQYGRPAVNFNLNAIGASRFGLLTQQYLPTGQFKRHLAVILNNKLTTAPTIDGVITSDGQIHGYDSTREAQTVVDVLRSGKLPAELNPAPISQQEIGPTLGRDNIIRGAIALAASLALVLLFLLFYYRLWLGGVACLVLITNLTLTLAAMMTIRAAFSLPGFAGMVLSIGMSIDANVLIYERMREELAKGASLRMAIRNGFDRAMSAIIDSNLTAVFTCIVLYAIGTEQIRGFSVVLILGLALSMFTSVVCSRLVFDIAERRRWLKRVTMMQFFTRPNINWLAKGIPAIVISLVIIGVGMAAVLARGKGILDIDFTGGTKTEMAFQSTQAEGKAVNVALVRDKVSDWSRKVESATGQELQSMLGEGAVARLRRAAPGFPQGDLAALPEDELERAKAFVDLPDVTVTEIEPSFTVTERPLAFYLNTSNTSVVGVETTLNRIFENQLVRNSFTYTGQFREETAPLQDPTAAEPVVDTGSPTAWVGTLQFRYGVTHEQVLQILRAHIAPNQPILVTNEAYEEGTSNIFNRWNVTVAGEPGQVEPALEAAAQSLAANPYFPETTNIGAAVAFDASINALVAFFASTLGIIVYLWVRFQKVAYGLAAVVAVLHDLLVTLGFLGLSYYLQVIPTVEPFKINLEIVAALLTIMGYSLNDTIVIFDRIREIRGKSPVITPVMVNRAINETLSRTIITSLLVFMTVLVMYFFGGGGTLHGFAFAMVVGVIAGSYSTMFIACPVILWLMKVQWAAKERTAPNLTGAKGASAA